MFRILSTIPQTVALACSGGPDSMAVLNFLQLHGKRKVYVLYMNHASAHGVEAEVFVRGYCESNNTPCYIGSLTRERNKDESPEEFWRNERYAFFERTMQSLPDMPLITAHHLDDQVENWLMTAMHGKPRLIPYRRGNILRPFLLTRKSDFLSWCERKSVPFLLDSSNEDIRYDRNRIRRIILPEVEKINPGIYKVVARLVEEAYANEI